MKQIQTIRDLPREELVVGGAPLCAGCPGALGLRLAMKALGKRTIIINASGCMTLFTTFPSMPTKVPWLHVAIENAGAAATGVRAALLYGRQWLAREHLCLRRAEAKCRI